MEDTYFDEIDNSNSESCSDNNPSIELSNTESEDDILGPNLDIFDDYFLSKSGEDKWFKSPINTTGRISSPCIIKNKPGLTIQARRIENKIDSLDLFMDDALKKKILKYSNQYALLHNSSWKQITMSEFNRFIGLLILLGVYKAKNEPIRDIWNKEDGRPVFSKSMSVNRFESILRYLRFDDTINRDRQDKGAAIKEVFESFRRKLCSGIVPSENLTVDEQLVNFFGRCSFKTYIPSKPGKFGIKIWVLCDAKTGYCLNQSIYFGKIQKNSPPEKNLGKNVALNLINTCMVKLDGRNITTDNFFSSLSLSQELLKKKLLWLEL